MSEQPRADPAPPEECPLCRKSITIEVDDCHVHNVFHNTKRAMEQYGSHMGTVLLLHLIALREELLGDLSDLREEVKGVDGKASQVELRCDDADTRMGEIEEWAKTLSME